MKNVLKAFGIIAVIAVIGFSITACGGGDDNNNNNENKPQTPETPKPFDNITAVQLVAKIKVGWILGNTLEATDYGEGWANTLTVEKLETLWGNPVTTKANIDAIKNAGFNAIRIPVTWTKAAGGAPDYTIRKDWMARVVEVVNYAVENDMYIILNTQHEEKIFTLMNSNTAAGKAAFQKIWEQIADTFKNYNEKLIFEGLNEPRTVDTDNEWSGGTSEERNNLNAYYQTFVNTVRNSGGNNDKRFLLINPYGANPWQAAADGLVLPTDTATNKLIVSIHNYSPYDFALNKDPTKNTWDKNNSWDTSPITDPIDIYYNKFVSKGIPVIMGEFGAMNKNNEDTRAQWAEYYVTYARSKGIPCLWWDNGYTTGDNELFGLLNRNNNTFYYPKVKEAIMRGTESTTSPQEPPASRETVVASYSAYASNTYTSLSSSVNYQIVNLTSESRNNVLKVVNPTEWAIAYYDLSSYKGQNKTITFSVQIKRVGASGTLNWQVNNNDYPSVGTPINNASAGIWHSMNGTWTGTPSDNEPKLYISTHENNSGSTTYYISNFTITVN